MRWILPYRESASPATRDLVVVPPVTTWPPIRWPSIPLAMGGPLGDHPARWPTARRKSGRYLRDFRLSRISTRTKAIGRFFDGHQSARLDRASVPQPALRATPTRMSGTGHGFLFFPDTTFPFAYGIEGRSVHRPGATASWRAASARNNCPKVGAHDQRHGILGVRPVADHHPIHRGGATARAARERARLSPRQHPACGDRDHAQRRVRRALQTRVDRRPVLRSRAAGLGQVGEGQRAAAGPAAIRASPTDPSSRRRRWASRFSGMSLARSRTQPEAAYGLRPLNSPRA